MIEDDPNVRKEEEFNAIKTWTEYINRLVGAVIGLLVLATFVTSLRYWKTKRSIPIASGLAVLLTLFQGWLGSIVVSTNLLPGTITIHMVFAMIIVSVLLYGAYLATSELITFELDEKVQSRLYIISVILFVLTIAQLVLGIQVREAVDAVKLSTDIARSGWLEQSGLIYVIHRSFSWLVLFAAIWMMKLLWKKNVVGFVYKLGITNFVLIAIQIIVGIGLEYLDLTAPLQVIHLVGVALMICTQFLMILTLGRKKEIKVSQVIG